MAPCVESIHVGRGPGNLQEHGAHPVIKPERIINPLPLGTMVDISARWYLFPNTLNSSLGAGPEVNQASVDDFKLVEDVAMYTQLPDYDDREGLDLSSYNELAAMSKGIYGHPNKISWGGA